MYGVVLNSVIDTYRFDPGCALDGFNLHGNLPNLYRLQEQLRAIQDRTLDGLRTMVDLEIKDAESWYDEVDARYEELHCAEDYFAEC